MENLWKDAFQIVSSYFQQDLPDTVLQVFRSAHCPPPSTDPMQHDPAWKGLESTKEFNHYVPLPQTNSSHAKHMRIAVVLARLAQAVDRYLFDPTYVLGADSGLRDTFLALAVEDNRRESYCRAVLLSIPIDKDDIAKRINSVIAEVVPPIRDLLADAAEQFEVDINKFAVNAYRTWSTMQRTTKRFESTFDISCEEAASWEPIQFSETSTVELPKDVEAGLDDALIIILPCLCLVVQGEEPRAVMKGRLLRRSQSILAAQELQASSSLLPSWRSTTTRHKAQRSRTLSSSVDRPFLGQVSASSEQ